MPHPSPVFPRESSTWPDKITDNKKAARGGLGSHEDIILSIQYFRFSTALPHPMCSQSRNPSVTSFAHGGSNSHAAMKFSLFAASMRRFSSSAAMAAACAPKKHAGFVFMGGASAMRAAQASSRSRTTAGLIARLACCPRRNSTQRIQRSASIAFASSFCVKLSHRSGFMHVRRYNLERLDKTAICFYQMKKIIYRNRNFPAHPLCEFAHFDFSRVADDGMLKLSCFIFDSAFITHSSMLAAIAA